jgi:hypothetical protein
MNSANLTLGDFVQQLLLQLGNRELRFKDERPWHELFYQLKTAPESDNKPRFLKDLFFDWNGEYPKSQELSEYLHGLHWTGCIDAANPTYDRIKLNQKVGDLWRTELEPGLATFIAGAAEVAARDLAV